MKIGRPETGEYAAYFAGYMAKAAAVEDPIAALQSQLDELLSFLRPLDSAQQMHRYAEGKWSIKEMVNHLTDSERIFAYRVMRIGRGDQTPLASFDEGPYVAAAGADLVEWDALVREFELVRSASIQLAKNLPPAAWMRMGTASGQPISVRAMVLIMYGHVAHHLQIIRERYL